MKPLIIIAGPTAVGKTKLSVMLAKKLGTSIISSDSVQMYRGLDIGSAKVTEEEMDGVKHYLIDTLSADEDYSVADYVRDASTIIDNISSDGFIPISVGGTGFYIDALAFGTEFSKEESDSSDEIRSVYYDIYSEKGVDALFEKLKEVDMASANVIHPNNVKRVIRALEYFDLHGEPISNHNETERVKESKYKLYYYVLNDDRATLYKRIDKRVDKMIKDGLIDEVESLIEAGYTPELHKSMQSIGYKQTYDYLTGKITFDDAIEQIKKDSRHYAKRQLTWFRRTKKRFDGLEFLNINEYGYDFEKILDYILGRLENDGLI